MKPERMKQELKILKAMAETIITRADLLLDEMERNDKTTSAPAILSPELQAKLLGKRAQNI